MNSNLKPKQRVIYDNFVLDQYREDAIETLQSNGILNPTEDQIVDEMIDIESDAWDDAKSSMKSIFDFGKFLAVGVCGRWDGNFAGGFIFDNFSDLMDHLQDCDFLKFWDENGHFFVEATHHDGTHHLEIKEITGKGENYYSNWDLYGVPNDRRTEREVHSRMFKSSRYSRLINFAHKKYGCAKREYVQQGGYSHVR